MAATKLSAQKRAVANYRRRLAEQGVARYEVRGLDRDKSLVRRLAERLSANDAEAQTLRSDLATRLRAPDEARGTLYAALRRSPLVGADLDLSRDAAVDRDVAF